MLVVENSCGIDEKEVNLTVLDETQAPPQKDVDLSPIPVLEFVFFVANNHKNGNSGFRDMYEV